MLVSRATGHVLDRPHGGPSRGVGQADRVVLGDDHPVNPEGVGGPQQRSEVPGVLDLVEGHEERRLAPLARGAPGDPPGRRTRLRRPGPRPPGARRAGDRRELLARAVGHLHAGLRAPATRSRRADRGRRRARRSRRRAGRRRAAAHARDYVPSTRSSLTAPFHLHPVLPGLSSRIAAQLLDLGTDLVGALEVLLPPAPRSARAMRRSTARLVQASAPPGACRPSAPASVFSSCAPRTRPRRVHVAATAGPGSSRGRPRAPPGC